MKVWWNREEAGHHRRLVRFTLLAIQIVILEWVAMLEFGRSQSALS